MTASPETGPVVLLYGCTECNWIYSPQTPEETTKKYLLIAQFKFEQHACLNIRRSGLNGPPEQPSPKDPERRTHLSGVYAGQLPETPESGISKGKAASARTGLSFQQASTCAHSG